MTADLEAALDDLHDAKPDGWFVGTPVYIEHRKAWEPDRPAGCAC